MNGEYVWLTDYVPKRRGRYAHDHGWTSTNDFPTGRLCLHAHSRNSGQFNPTQEPFALAARFSFCAKVDEPRMLTANIAYTLPAI